MFDANLAIPAQIYHELLREQRKVYGRTDGQTERLSDGRTDRRTTTIPLRPESQGVKTNDVIAYPRPDLR